MDNFSANYLIWRMQAQDDVPGLIKAIHDPDVDIRRRAIAALRTMGATNAIPALQSALVSEDDPDVRTALMSTLDFLFQKDIDEDENGPADERHKQIVRMVGQLHSNSPARIIQAARALGELREKIAAETLVMVFRNQTHPPAVRLAAAEALVKLESAPVEVSLLGALTSPDWHVRRNAVAVLGQLRADWAIDPLSMALHDTHERVRTTARAALKRIGVPEALAVLERNDNPKEVLEIQAVLSNEAETLPTPVVDVTDEPPTTEDDTQPSNPSEVLSD
ncbi:MAG: HEAT repeat domain-containing protein [Anaerolineaceae bacterium]|nr:HEAT repeat domain-containing protein [Anaerolineaceae bacterium]